MSRFSTCHDCGGHDAMFDVGTRATGKVLVCKACHHERFWQEKIRWRQAGAKTPTGDRALVIDGWHYTVSPDKPAGYVLVGMGGRPFDIELMDPDGTTFTTRNLWTQGEVPERFRDRLTDNARFVTGGRTKAGETTCWQEARR